MGLVPEFSRKNGRKLNFCFTNILSLWCFYGKTEPTWPRLPVSFACSAHKGRKNIHLISFLLIVCCPIVYTQFITMSSDNAFFVPNVFVKVQSALHPAWEILSPFGLCYKTNERPLPKLCRSSINMSSCSVLFVLCMATTQVWGHCRSSQHSCSLIYGTN